MRSFTAALHDVLLTLWIGGLWIVGYLVAPVLFAELPDRMLAGRLAGEMFRWIGWIGLAAGTFLALFQLARQRWQALRSLAFWLVLCISDRKPLWADLAVARPSILRVKA